MLGGFVSGIIVAWILSLFGVDRMLIYAIQPFVTQVQLTEIYYYLAFGMIGLVGGALTRCGGKNN